MVIFLLFLLPSYLTVENLRSIGFFLGGCSQMCISIILLEGIDLKQEISLKRIVM